MFNISEATLAGFKDLFKRAFNFMNEATSGQPSNPDLPVDIYDSDLEASKIEASISFRAFFDDDDKNLHTFYLLWCHCLCYDYYMNSNASQGVLVQYGILTSQSVQGVSASYSMPRWLDTTNPLIAFLNSTPYGQKYLAMVRGSIESLALVGGGTSFLP